MMNVENCRITLNLDEEATIREHSKILYEIILQYKYVTKKINKIKEQYTNDEFVILTGNRICSDLGIVNSVVSIRTIDGIHNVLAVKLDDKYYILEPNYKKYFDNNRYKNERFFSKKIFFGNMNCFVNNTKYGKKFADNVFRNGYFECNEENMKIYCDGFVLSCYNYGKNQKDLVYETNISGQYYLDLLINKRFIDSNHYQNDLLEGGSLRVKN